MVYGKQYSLDTTTSEVGQEWKPMNEEQSYWISNFGHFKSYKNYVCDKFLILTQNNKGYLRVELSMNGKSKKYLVHKLVAEYFYQKPKDNKKYQVHHKDGNKHNNHISNLKYVTPQEHRKIHEQIRKQKKKKKCI